MIYVSKWVAWYDGILQHYQSTYRTSWRCMHLCIHTYLGADFDTSRLQQLAAYAQQTNHTHYSIYIPLTCSDCNQRFQSPIQMCAQNLLKLPLAHVKLIVLCQTSPICAHCCCHTNLISESVNLKSVLYGLI